MLLAIDTSTQIASLAILRDEQVWGELTWRVGHDHSRELLPNVLHLLRQYAEDRAEAGAPGDALADVSGLVVAIGPGSFNGVRVALSTAKGLAIARGLPLVGISTLESQAYQHAASGRTIWSLLRAGKDHLAAGVYRQRDGEWLTLAPPHLTTLDELCARPEEPVLICGEIYPHPARELEEKLGERAVVVPAFASLRRAAFLAELGHARLERGERDDVARLQPLYLRRPEITPRRERG